ncbi:MAG: hypothetical protein KAW82_05530, partial [Desulfurellaceae bacterium]|nr:hypothetical protein [Desulfurellaceae bacterium]
DEKRILATGLDPVLCNILTKKFCLGVLHGTGQADLRRNKKIILYPIRLYHNNPEAKEKNY